MTTRWYRLLALGAVAAALGAPAASPQAQPPAPAATPAPPVAFPVAPAAQPAEPPAWSAVIAGKNGKVMLDFRGADIDNVLRFYSMASGITITKDPALKGPVTMLNATSLTLDQAFHILEAVLNSKNYRLTNEGPVLRVVSMAQGRSYGPPGAFPGGFSPGQRPEESTRRPNEIRVFPLQYADATQVTRIVNDLYQQRGAAMAAMAAARAGGRPGGGGPGGRPGSTPGSITNLAALLPDVRASSDEYTNSVIVNGNPDTILQVETLIKQLDKQVPTTMQTRVFPLEYATAQDVANAVSSVLLATAPGMRTAAASSIPFEQRVRGGGGRSSYSAVRTQVVPDTRTNSLIVTATPEHLELVESVIKELDQPVQYETTTFIFPVQNAQATDIATLLGQALRSGGSSYRGGQWSAGGYRQGSSGSRPGSSSFRPSSQPTGSSSRPGGNRRSRDPDQPPGAHGEAEAAAEETNADAEGWLPVEDEEDADGRPAASRQFQPGQGGGFSVYGGSRARTGRTGRGEIINLLELTGQVSIVPDPNTNSLIINATPESYEALQRLLAQLDTMPAQVMIEAIIAEVTLDASTKLGLEWNWIQNNVFNGSVTTTAGLALPDLSQGPAFKLATAGGSLQATLTALSTDKRFNVLSTPRIFTSNNRQAQINISQNVPYVANYRETDAGTRTSNIAYLNVGIVLTVTPHITKNGLVNIEVSQEANELQGYTTFQAPLVSQRSADTAITIRDGETVILGGIIRQQTDESINKVPILGDLPIVGGFFRSKGKNKTKTELMVFLTPRIVHDAAQATALTDEHRQSIHVELPLPPGPLPGAPMAVVPPEDPKEEAPPEPGVRQR
ncbi:MAG: type II secretion system secretin GspD [Armatimonadetes bacterium]|nr:type II secretion system secretin GspD [Armatimonadota bacterium]